LVNKTMSVHTSKKSCWEKQGTSCSLGLGPTNVKLAH
jgi:hypothetical protein